MMVMVMVRSPVILPPAILPPRGQCGWKQFDTLHIYVNLLLDPMNVLGRAEAE